MRVPHRAFPKRSAFSLVEMLVVIAIIMILLALLAGAVMAMMSVAPQQTTGTLLSKVATALSGKWSAVSGKARQDDAVPSGFPSAGDVDATRNSYIAAMQQREFPTTFAAATSSPAAGIAPNSFYVSYLAGKSPAGLSAQMQSSVCLYMILSAGQVGMPFNINNLSPAEVGVEPNTGLKYVKDAWGMPVQLSLPNGPAVTSAGPDKTFNTVDDITISKTTGQTNVIAN